MAEWQQGEYTISTDPQRLDIGVIHGYLAEESYWARHRPLAVTQKALAHSLCFGVYQSNQQVGLARVVTDYATHAYLCDVFILPAHQGKGLGKWLMQCMLAHTAAQGVYKWALHTRDAHGLYAQVGFAAPQANAYMEIRQTPAWAAPQNT